MASSARDVRVQREKKVLLTGPYASSIADMAEEVIRLRITGPEDSAYDGLVYTLKISFPPNYPFYPPSVYFEAPVPYHPNIAMDTGAICLDVLKMAPVGCWKANIGIFIYVICIGIEAVIEAVTRLLAEPNVDDPLSFDVAKEFLVDHAAFCSNIRITYHKQVQK